MADVKLFLFLTLAHSTKLEHLLPNPPVASSHPLSVKMILRRKGIKADLR